VTTSRELIERYNAAWNARDVDAIVAFHAPDMVFENHTAGEFAVGDEIRDHVAGIFETWPDLSFRTRRLLTGPDHAVCEWMATATHTRTMRRGEIVAEPTGRRVSWRGVDVFTIVGGKIARKDVYADSVTILRELGLLPP
jgi:steroid delta-isomerase-like uncharacterized protein